MDTMPPPTRDEALQAFGRLFDAGQYWDSHEALEAWWQHERLDLWQALIQLAAAFVHIDAGRRGGAMRVLSRALDRLDREAASVHGIDVERIRDAAHRCMDHLQTQSDFDDRLRFAIGPLLGR
jgi:hypothetical protein